jgi:hypothetical protein
MYFQNRKKNANELHTVHHKYQERSVVEKTKHLPHISVVQDLFSPLPRHKFQYDEIFLSQVSNHNYLTLSSCYSVGNCHLQAITLT